MASKDNGGTMSQNKIQETSDVQSLIKSIDPSLLEKLLDALLNEQE